MVERIMNEGTNKGTNEEDTSRNKLLYGCITVMCKKPPSVIGVEECQQEQYDFIKGVL